jgi:hypothetical protein
LTGSPAGSGVIVTTAAGPSTTPEVTAAHVVAVIGPTGWDPAAGAAAAREFLSV